MRCILSPRIQAKLLGGSVTFYSPHVYRTLFRDSPLLAVDGFCVDKSYIRSYLGAIARLYYDLDVGSFSVLHVKGIGFKVYYHRRAHALYFLLGYNHVTKILVPPDIVLKVRKQYILLFSHDSNSLGKYLALIRSLRSPDPYRGKGIRFRYQVIKFKLGKQR
jgi:ribosomal protein L6P/L9E